MALKSRSSYTFTKKMMGMVFVLRGNYHKLENFCLGLFVKVINWLSIGCSTEKKFKTDIVYVIEKHAGVV